MTFVSVAANISNVKLLSLELFLTRLKICRAVTNIAVLVENSSPWSILRLSSRNSNNIWPFGGRNTNGQPGETNCPIHLTDLKTN